MNKKMAFSNLILAFCLMAQYPTFQQNVDSTKSDFRDVMWGMTKEEVRKIENNPNFRQIDNLLVNNSEAVAGFKCILYYNFVDNKLASGVYSFKIEHLDNSKYIDDFNKLKELLTNKYGKPIIEEEKWKNNLYKDDYRQCGTAVRMGHLGYFTQWRNTSTIIDLLLYGKNLKIVLMMKYTSIRFLELELKQQEEEKTGKRDPSFQSKVDSTKSDFRDVMWGMTKEEVRNTEKDKLIYLEDPIFLSFKEEVAGFECLLTYYFVDNKLVSGMYLFTMEHSNENNYIVDFYTLKNLLTKKYGKPDVDIENWNKDLYKNDYQHLGMAVAIGHLSYAVRWKTPSSQITLSLNGDNNKIKFAISYTSLKLQELEWKQIEERLKSKL